MSDFPKGGDIQDTRAWLDKEGFVDVFKGSWKADAILGLDKSDILSFVPGEDGLKLWGFLNTARQTFYDPVLQPMEGNTSIYKIDLRHEHLHRE